MTTAPEYNLMSITDMVLLWGVHRLAVTQVVKGHGLQPRSMPRMGNAKLFGLADQAVIRKALGLDREPALAESA